MYADDAVNFYTNPSIEEIKSVLTNDLENLQTWTSCYKLCIHPVKTEYVLFGTQQRLSSAERLNLYLGDKIIKQVQHYEYLGVIIDAHLNFKEQVDKILKKFQRELVLLVE